MNKLPEPVERVLRFAGKTRREVVNPCLTARETIELANWIVENCKIKEIQSERTEN